MTMKSLASVGAIGAALALSACVGTSTSSFGGLAGDAQALFSKNGVNSIRSESLTFASTDAPMSGSASFTGFAGIEVVEVGGSIFGLERVADVDLLGDFTMTTNFTPAGGTVSGSATNFYDNSDTSYAGSLAFNGSISRSAADVDNPNGQAMFVTTVGGSLTGDGTYAGVYSGGATNGTFSQGGSLMIGFGSGDVALSSGTPKEGFGIAVVAERD